MVLTKICGVTRPEDLIVCADAGADLVGLIVGVERSPRALTLEEAARLAGASRLPVVILLERPGPEIASDAVRRCEPWGLQLVGGEAPEEVAELRASLERDGSTGRAVRLLVSVGVPAARRMGKAGKRTERLVGAGSEGAAIAELARVGADEVVFDTAGAVGGQAGAVEGQAGAVGGTGVLGDWTVARELVSASRLPAWLAGGLTPATVADAISAVGPHGVDVSSGVELRPGVKDPQAVREFVRAARAARSPGSR